MVLRKNTDISVKDELRRGRMEMWGGNKLTK
jgi:hypothetical protein